MEEKNRFYWIKLRTDFFNQSTIDFLMSQDNGSDYVVLYQMLCLQTANTNGELTNKIGEVIVPYNIEKIVRDTKYFSYDTVMVALELYKKIGLVYVEENGNLKITDIEKMIGSETKWAEKKRLYREKKLIGQCEDNVREEIRDKRLDIRDKNIDIDNSSSSIYDYYQNEIGTLSTRQYEILDDYLNYLPIELIKEAINKAADNGVKSFSYINKILTDWKQKEYKSIGDIKNEKKNSKDDDFWNE